LRSVLKSIALGVRIGPVSYNVELFVRNRAHGFLVSWEWVWTYVFRSGELYFADDHHMLQIDGKNVKISGTAFIDCQ
jgi:hypothetical protein